jgi:hypothetical protein
MKITIILLAFLSVSCGLRKEKKIKTYNVHPELQSFVTSFQAKMKMAGRNSAISDLEAHFSDSLGNTTQGTIIGTCQRQNITRDKGLTVETVETPIVKINREWWYHPTTSNADREELMNHELGHCILNRAHDTTVISGLPKSIMYPSHLGNQAYTDNYSNYITELFGATAVAFSGITFDDGAYASVYVEESHSYEEKIEDDSHIKDCVHHNEPVYINETEEAQE